MIFTIVNVKRQRNIFQGTIFYLLQETLKVELFKALHYNTRTCIHS